MSTIISSNTVRVSLDGMGKYRLTAKDLHAVFSRYGSCAVEVGAVEADAVIAFTAEDHADRAISDLHGKVLSGDKGRLSVTREFTPTSKDYFAPPGLAARGPDGSVGFNTPRSPNLDTSCFEDEDGKFEFHLSEESTTGTPFSRRVSDLTPTECSTKRFVDLAMGKQSPTKPTTFEEAVARRSMGACSPPRFRPVSMSGHFALPRGKFAPSPQSTRLSAPRRGHESVRSPSFLAPERLDSTRNSFYQPLSRDVSAMSWRSPASQERQYEQQACLLSTPKSDPFSPESKQHFDRFKGVEHLAATGLKFTCRFGIGIENDRAFQVSRKIIGTKGANMKKIFMETGCKLRLRGIGSGFREGDDKQEANEPLQLCISSLKLEDYDAAIDAVRSILINIYAEYSQHCISNGMVDPALKVQVNEHPMVTLHRENLKKSHGLIQTKSPSVSTTDSGDGLHKMMKNTSTLLRLVESQGLIQTKSPSVSSTDKGDGLHKMMLEAKENGNEKEVELLEKLIKLRVN